MSSIPFRTFARTTTESANGVGRSRVNLMPDEAREMRDMLIEIRSDVKQLIYVKDDHEKRLREHEVAINTMQSSSNAQAANSKRLLAWGMLLAALAGGAGDFLRHALGLPAK